MSKLRKCYKCKNNAFWKCSDCDNWCCHKHIDYHFWYVMSSTEGMQKRHGWLCEDCIQKLKEWEEHASKIGDDDGK